MLLLLPCKNSCSEKVFEVRLSFSICSYYVHVIHSFPHVSGGPAIYENYENDMEESFDCLFSLLLARSVFCSAVSVVVVVVAAVGREFVLLLAKETLTECGKWHAEQTCHFLLFFLLTCPRGGVRGRLAFTPAYGNFFLSAGFRICYRRAKRSGGLGDEHTAEKRCQHT